MESDADLILVLFVTARGVEVHWDSKSDAYQFLYAFDEMMISALPDLVPLMRISASGECVEVDGGAMKKPKYHGALASHGISKMHAHDA